MKSPNTKAIQKLGKSLHDKRNKSQNYKKMWRKEYN